MQEQNKSTLTTQAHQLLNQGRLQEALACYKNIVSIDDKDPNAWLATGMISGQLGHLEEAAHCFKNVTTLAPNNALGFLNLAKAQQARRLFDEASVNYKAALDITPSLSEAWLSLGNLKWLAGDFIAAEDCFRNLVTQQPQNVAAHASLATMLQAQTKYDAAIQSYLAAIQLSPGNAEIHSNLGVTLQKAGRLGEAVAYYQKAVSLKPDYAIAHYNLGTALKDQGSLTAAISEFELALQHRPNYPEALNATGLALHALGEYRGAIRYYRLCVESSPEYSDAYCNMGYSQLELAQLDEAHEAFEKALQINPRHTNALAGLASSLEKRGEHASAYRTILPTVTTEAPTPIAAKIYATICQRLEKYPDALECLEHALSLDSLKNTERASLLFSMGDILDASKKHDRAFEYYSQANTLSPYRFNPDAHKRIIDNIIESHPKDETRQTPRASTGSDRPIFIIGMPRSGTSLVEQIIASHPLAYGGGELPYIGEMLSGLNSHENRSSYFEGTNELHLEAVESASKDYLAKLESISTSAARVTDKMPHNFLALGFISRLFPEAHIIHCTRNPLDTCLSIYFHNFNARHPYATDLSSLAIYYQQYQRLMAHWKSVLNLSIFEVEYEQLVRDQAQVTRDLIDYTGLQWNENCLDFHNTKRAVATPSYDQVRRAIYTSSVERWKNYEKHIPSLISAFNL